MVGVWYGCGGGAVDCMHKLETVEGGLEYKQGLSRDSSLLLLVLAWLHLFSGIFFLFLCSLVSDSEHVIISTTSELSLLSGFLSLA
jgi:hypothetical protein